MNDTVFFIGDVALDEYYAAPYFPKIKDKVIVQTLKPEMGGMIANAACVFSSLGGNTGFIAALNSGYISRKLCEDLNRFGIDTRFVSWDDSLPDSKTIIILAEDEHTVFIPTMNLQKLALSDEAYAELMHARYVYSNICELRPLCHKNDRIEQLFSSFKKCGVKLWLDIDVADIGTADEFFFDYTDTLFVNEKGKERLENIYHKEIHDFMYSHGINQLIVTEAENGCSIFSKENRPIKIGGIKVKVLDVTGAGDTFCSSYLFAYIKTNDPFLSGQFANYAASRSVTGKGARFGAADFNTIMRFINDVGGNPDQFRCLLDDDKIVL